MASDEYALTVSGDVTGDELAAVSQILREGRPQARVQAGSVVDRAGVFTTPEVLATAAAIAAVLQFLLEMWSAWRSEKVLPSQDLRPVLIERLKRQGCEGIEVSDMKIQMPGKTQIVLYDVPEQTRIEIQVQDDSRVTIRKNRQQSERSS